MGACFVFFDIFLIVLAVFFPPLPVWIKAGFCSADSFINICLCILGYFPGLIHSWYIISKYPEVIEFDIESQHLRHSCGETHTIYVNVTSPGPVSSPSLVPQESQHPESYGAIAGGSSSTDVVPGDAPPAYRDFESEPSVAKKPGK